MTPASLTWGAPPATLHLTPNSVHLWRAWLDPENPPAGLWEALSQPEQQQAVDLQPGRPRQRFIASRGLRRRVLAHYTGDAPAHLRFDLGAHGKPALSSGFGDGAIHFNLSHSHELLLCAVSRQRRVGVDVERVRPLPAIDRMAGRVMSDAEAAAWQALPAEEKLPVFFSTWTRKEALVKGQGERLAAAFARVDVTLAPGQQTTQLSGQDDQPAWLIYSLSVVAGYAGAVAIEETEPVLEWHSYHLM
ncbi:MAG: 4'-phosphopantetheinyl transferase superfamily protein [Anaerolineae bacterium]